MLKSRTMLLVPPYFLAPPTVSLLPVNTSYAYYPQISPLFKLEKKHRVCNLSICNSAVKSHKNTLISFHCSQDFLSLFLREPNADAEKKERGKENKIRVNNPP